MKTIVKLTEAQKQEQARYAAKYLELINKELGYGDLCDLENINSYAKSYKHHLTLSITGIVEL